MPLTFWSRVREARLVRVVAVYLAASWLILQATSLFIESLDLPRWFMPAAILLLGIGLLVISATAWVQSHPSTTTRAATEEVPGAWEIDLGEAKDSLARGRLPHLTWARAIVGGVVAFSLLVGVAAVYVLVKGRVPSLGPVTVVAGDAAPGIAVLPFTVRGTGLDVWREGMVDVLSTNLDGVAGLRAIDARTVVARWREQVQGTEAPDLTTALEVARRTGARYALLGEVLGVGSNVRFTAGVYDLDNGAKLDQQQVEGAPDSIFQLVDRLSLQILVAVLQRAPGELPAVSLAHLTTTSVPALKAFLQGEAEFRRSAFESAVVAYQRALEADSLFPLALYRLGLASSWDLQLGRYMDYIQRAARFANRLPDREALLSRAYLAVQQGSLSQLEPVRRATQKYPEDAEIWYQLGETYFHLGSAALVDPDASERAFRQAIKLDPTFAPAYIHSIHNVFLYHPDSTRAASLIETYARLAQGSQLDHANRIALGLAFGDSPTRARAQAELSGLKPALLWALTEWYVDHPRFLDQEDTIFQILRSRGDSTYGEGEPVGMLIRNKLRRGKVHEALNLLDDQAAPEWTRVALIYTAVAEGVPIPPDRLLREMSRSGTDSTFYERDLYAGAYAADRGRWSEHGSALQRLSAQASQSLAEGDTLRSERLSACAEALEAYRLWKQGAREAAVHGLQNALPQLSTYHSATYTIRVWLGMLLLEMNHPREAHPYLASFWNYHPLYPLAQNLLGQIYEELGEYEKAREAYSAFVSAWQDADPELQLKVQEARAAIQRLTSAIHE